MLDIRQIPKLKIAKSTIKNEFKILSNNLINLITKSFINFKNEIETEKIISIENNNYDKLYYKGCDDAYNIIMYNFYTQLNSLNFWDNMLVENTCNYIIKNENNYDYFCGRRIDIKCKHKDGKYRCSTHISSKYHIPKKRNIEDNNKCIEYNKHDERCGNPKRYGNICKKHYSTIHNIAMNLVDDHYILQEEINLLYNITVKKTNNCILGSFKYNCKINKKLIIIDKYEKLNDNNKLLCYYNDKSYSTALNIQEEGEKEINYKNSIILENNEKMNKNIGNLKEVTYDGQMLEIKEIYNKTIDLNINIENFKYKMDIINEILKINPTCSIKGCNKINNIKIINLLYCKNHAMDELNAYKNNKYKINNWNYL